MGTNTALALSTTPAAAPIASTGEPVVFLLEEDESLEQAIFRHCAEQWLWYLTPDEQDFYEHEHRCRKAGLPIRFGLAG